MIHRFLRDESGGTAIEYGLICCLIFLVIVSAAVTLSDNLINNFWKPTAAAMKG